ncbi:trp operon leader peptide [Escherichia coli]
MKAIFVLKGWWRTY